MRNRVLDRIQTRLKTQDSEREEISQNRRISYQTVVMTMAQPTRVPHFNHVPLVVGIPQQLLTMLSLLRTTPLVDNLRNLDDGIRLILLLPLQQRIPMLLPPRTGLQRKILDDLALELDLLNPNPPNQQHLLIHPEKIKAERFLLIPRKEMI